MAKVSVVLGLNYSDEGKGKVSTFLAINSDIALRCTGGNNAGHTVELNGQKNYDELDEKTKVYIKRIEKHLNIPVKFIGTGPDNDDMIIR